MDQIASATNGISGTATQFGDCGAGGKKQSIFTNLRAMIFSTIYGLIGETIAKSIGAGSQFNAAMSLTGSDQGAQGLAGTKLLRGLAGSVPFAGTALSALAGAAGLDAIDAQIALSGQQDTAIDAQTAAGFGAARSRTRGLAARSGSFGAAQAGLAAQRIDVRQQAAKTSQASMAAWDAAHPERPGNQPMGVLGFLTGGAVSNLYRSGIINTPMSDTDISDRNQMRNTFRMLQGRNTTAAINAVEDEAAKLDREQKYQISSAKNTLELATMENRFRPARARGAYAVSQFGTERNRLGPNANMQDLGYLRIQGETSIQELRSGQRDIANNLIFGSARNYNPYTESPLAYTERTTETTNQAFMELQTAIQQLTAEIAKLPKI